MNQAAASQIIKCPKCGANNRVSIDQSNSKQAVCGRCKELLPLVSNQPVIVTDANYKDVVEKSALPVLLDLWAAWCQPCQIIAPTVEQLARELSGKVLVGKLNVDENKATAANFSVQGIPTLLILQNGWEVDRIVGVASKEAVLQRLQRFM
jgi:thioredoxin